MVYSNDHFIISVHHVLSRCYGHKVTLIIEIGQFLRLSVQDMLSSTGTPHPLSVVGQNPARST